MDFIDYLAGYHYIVPLFFFVLIAGSVLGGIWMTRNNAFGLQGDDWLLGYIISQGIIFSLMFLAILFLTVLIEAALILEAMLFSCFGGD